MDLEDHDVQDVAHLAGLVSHGVLVHLEVPDHREAHLALDPEDVDHESGSSPEVGNWHLVVALLVLEHFVLELVPTLVLLNQLSYLVDLVDHAGEHFGL